MSCKGLRNLRLITEIYQIYKELEITEPLTCHCVQHSFKYVKSKKLSDPTIIFLKFSDAYFSCSNISEEKVNFRGKS